MLNLKSKNFGKKLAAILLAAVAVTVPALSFGLTSNNSHAQTIYQKGALISHRDVAEVVKDTICVKRWHLYSFDLYYEGTYEDIFVENIHTPVFANCLQTITLKTEDQLINSYTVSETEGRRISASLKVISGAKVAEFLSSAEAYVTEEYYHSITKTVSTSYIHTISDTFVFDLAKDNLPINCYYGNMLRLSKANRFKLVVKEKQQAKTRKSALHNWSDYKVEIDETTTTHYFYASYLENGASYYQLTGCLGDQANLDRLSRNAVE